jgi:hypothetical protein
MKKSKRIKDNLMGIQPKGECMKKSKRIKDNLMGIQPKGECMKPETIKIDDMTYVRQDLQTKMAENLDGMKFCIIRTYSAGVFAGYVKSIKGQEVELVNSIRLWQWFGASLSQLSQEGTPDASKCRFAMTEKTKILTQAIEITECTEKARLNLQAVKQWKI